MRDDHNPYFVRIHPVGDAGAGNESDRVFPNVETESVESGLTENERERSAQDPGAVIIPVVILAPSGGTTGSRF